MEKEYENAIKYFFIEFSSLFNKHNDIVSRGDVRKTLNDYLTQNTKELPDEIHEQIDIILQYELIKRNIIDGRNLFKNDNFNDDFNDLSQSIKLFYGDITTLKVDCIVNAANENGLGCFKVGHRCIDNVIHSRAGPRMRENCMNILNNNKIKVGDLIVTKGYNLPCRYVFHCVGPIYDHEDDRKSSSFLIKAYMNCLNKAKNMRIDTIAFCCISTGEFGYPKDKACLITLNTTKYWLKNNKYRLNIIFSVYTDIDNELYQENIRKNFMQQ